MEGRAMRQKDRQNRRWAEAEAARLNPIVLILALWLGTVVLVAGLIRLSEAVAMDTAVLRDQPSVEQSVGFEAPLGLPSGTHVGGR